MVFKCIICGYSMEIHPFVREDYTSEDRDKLVALADQLIEIPCADEDVEVTIWPNMLVSSCGHLFHEICIIQWLYKSRKSNYPLGCPTCDASWNKPLCLRKIFPEVFHGNSRTPSEYASDNTETDCEQEDYVPNLNVVKLKAELDGLRIGYSSFLEKHGLPTTTSSGEPVSPQNTSGRDGQGTSSAPPIMEAASSLKSVK